MTALQKRPDSQVAHLTPDDIDQIGRELDALRDRVFSSLGERDAAYIRRVIDVHRKLELGSRALLIAGRFPGAWLLGTIGLSVAKILDNMEIGHNVLHGQWDWMRDPKIHSTTWDWDHASPPELWQRAHNQRHHTYTNILGKDNDLGYGIMRVDEDQPWEPRHLFQPVQNFVTACIFEYGIAMFDLDLGDHLRKDKGLTPALRDDLNSTLNKIRKQATKDYVVHPILSGYGWRRTLAANAVANVVRNLWSHSVIMCGHFPEGVETFELETIDPKESRGQWYLRQMLGSANIRGSKLDAPDERQPEPPDRAPHLPGPAQQPVRRDLPRDPGPLQALRAEVPLGADGPAGRLGLAQGLPALPAQRVPGRDHAWKNSPRQLKKLARMALGSRQKALGGAPAMKALPAAG